MANQLVMKKSRAKTSLMRGLAIAACLSLWLLGGSYAPGSAASSQINYPKTVDPYEVIVYEHSDFVGVHVSFRLDPSWMRQRLVPDLSAVTDDKPAGQAGSTPAVVGGIGAALNMNDRISSIQVGERVGVILFQHPHFIGAYAKPHLASNKDLPVSGENDNCSSLIVFSKDAGEPLGVFLAHELYNGAFFPLPESLFATEIKYPTIPDFIDNESEWVHPSHKNIAVTLCDETGCAGKCITLPGAGGPSAAWYELNKYGWDEMASSLEIRWTGPPPPPPPKVGGAAPAGQPSWQAGAAKPAGPAPPKVVGVRPMAGGLEDNTDRPGLDYKSFWVSGGPEDCRYACEADVDCKAFTYVRAGVQGPQARCYLKYSIPNAVPNKDCVSGVRSPQAGQAPGEAGPGPVKPSLPDISGKWDRSIGVAYEITQSGNQFSWNAAKTRWAAAH